MPVCYYCSNDAITKRKIAEGDGEVMEVDVCEDCANAIDDGLLTPDPYDPY